MHKTCMCRLNVRYGAHVNAMANLPQTVRLQPFVHVDTNSDITCLEDCKVTIWGWVKADGLKAQGFSAASANACGIPAAVKGDGRFEAALYASGGLNVDATYTISGR